MNVFEKIIKGEVPCQKVLETEEFLAFHDINPKAPIHVLAIPKVTYKDLNSIPEEVLGRLGKFCVEVAQQLGIKEHGYRVITNVGRDGGQEVPHFHFHILGGERLKWGGGLT